MKRMIIILILMIMLFTPQIIFCNPVNQKQIDQAEYFFSDDPSDINFDPGFGKAIPLDIYNESVLPTEIDTSNLSIGNHYIVVRLKDSDEKWGPARQYKIEIRDPYESTVKRAEYFIGHNDPGRGNATPLTPNINGVFEETLDTSNMEFDSYTLSVRIMDSLTRWGKIYTDNFEVREHQYPTIHGNITTFVAGWNSLPVRNASVSLRDTGYSTETDLNGNFKLLDIPIGEYTLVVNSEGLIPISKQFKWNGTQNLYLKEIPIPLSIFDPDKNGLVGLQEAINALQVVAGIKKIDHSNLPEIPDDQLEIPSAVCNTTQLIHCGEIIVLDGSDSFNRYCSDCITYNWNHMDGVSGTFITDKNSKIVKFKSDSSQCEVGQTSTFRLTVTNQWGVEDITECQVSYQSELVEIKRYKFEYSENYAYDYWTTSSESEPPTYTYESSLGYALKSPIEGKTIPIYSCEATYYSKIDRYLSKDMCNPQYCADFAKWRSLQNEPIFYLYKEAGENRELIRSCWTQDRIIRDTFASKALSCGEEVSNSYDVGENRSPLGYAIKHN